MNYRVAYLLIIGAATIQFWPYVLFKLLKVIGLIIDKLLFITLKMFSTTAMLYKMRDMNSWSKGNAKAQKSLKDV